MGHVTVTGPRTAGLRARLPRRFALVIGLAALALLFGACRAAPSAVARTGSSKTTASTARTSSTTASSGHGARSAQQSGIAFAACVRSHGVANFPDSAISTSSKGVELSVPQGVNPNSPQFQAALQACRSLLPQGANSGSSAPSQSYTSAVLKFAGCMRTHGVASFPEPNSQGETVITGTGINPNSPTFQSAFAACQKYLPAGAVGG